MVSNILYKTKQERERGDEEGKKEEEEEEEEEVRLGRHGNEDARR